MAQWFDKNKLYISLFLLAQRCFNRKIKRQLPRLAIHASEATNPSSRPDSKDPKNSRNPSLSDKICHLSCSKESVIIRQRGPTRGGTQSRNHADSFSFSRIHAMRRTFRFSRNIAIFGLKIGHFTKSRRKNLIFTNSRRIFMLFTHHAWKSFHAFTQIFFRFHAFTQ